MKSNWRPDSTVSCHVYAIVGEQASDDDEPIGTFFTGELAAAAVAGHNHLISRPPPSMMEPPPTDNTWLVMEDVPDNGLMPLVTRRFGKLPGRRPELKTLYCHVSTGVLDIFGTTSDKSVVVNVLLHPHLDSVGLLRAADYALRHLGLEVVGGWRLPLKPDGDLIATAAVRRIKPAQARPEYTDPHP